MPGDVQRIVPGHENPCAVPYSNKENEPSITLLYDKERQESYPIDLLKSKNPFAFQLIMTVQRPGSTWDEKMMEGYSEDSNPVLMLVTLKSPEQK